MVICNMAYIRDIIVLYPADCTKSSMEHIPWWPLLELPSSNSIILVNSLWPSDVIWRQEIWVNIGLCNGFLPDGTKPLPVPMLTDHQWSPKDASIINHWNPFENYISKISFKFPRGQWVKQLQFIQNVVTSSWNLLLAHPHSNFTKW